MSPLKRLVFPVLACLYSRDLPKLSRLYGTDKEGGHSYARHYQAHFARWRRKRVTLLEIGVGGYEDPREGGQSLRMWKRYFPKGRIYSIDVHDKRALEEERIRIFRGSQDDPEFLRRVIAETGAPDIVIDDGSHVNAHVIRSFETLFPLLADGGIYAVEDVQTSYWPGFGGRIEPDGGSGTIMGYFKALADGLNHAEWIRPGYVPTYLDTHASAVHFHHNLIFVFKGANDEPSNVLRANDTDLDWVKRPSS
jgi:hypothetical protein